MLDEPWKDNPHRQSSKQGQKFKAVIAFNYPTPFCRWRCSFMSSAHRVHLSRPDIKAELPSQYKRGRHDWIARAYYPQSALNWPIQHSMQALWSLLSITGQRLTEGHSFKMRVREASRKADNFSMGQDKSLGNYLAVYSISLSSPESNAFTWWE